MTAVADALYSKLTGDVGAGGIVLLSPGGFHNGGIAPQGTARPYTTYQFISSTPAYVITGEYWRRLRVHLKCFGTTDQGWTGAYQMADRLEAILTDGTLTITGYALKNMRLFQRIDMSEMEGGILYPSVFLDYVIEIGA